jgi:hypothetical protein
MVAKDLAATPDSVREIHGLIDEVAKVDDDKQENNAVYVLECVQYIKNDNKMREHLKRRHTPDRDDGPTTWRYPTVYDSAIFADVVYYVGESGNLSQRIKDHVSMQGSTLTEGFPPCSIERIEWVDSREAALERESELIDELGNIDELPSHIGFTPHHNADHSDLARQNVKDVFPSKLKSLSDREIKRYSHAIGYAREQDDVLMSDTEKIKEIATDRVKELKEKEPEKIIYAQGG